MLNIISLSFYSKRISGPKKVFDNVIKGLKVLGYPYVINKRLDSTRRLWIHDDVAALEDLSSLEPQIKVIIGPNLFIPAKDFPHLPRHLDLSRVVYLQPSEWIKQYWLDFGFTQCPIEAWPVGIDLDECSALENRSGDYVLVYFKQRFDYELDAIISTLERRKIPLKIITYRHYKQNEYLELLRNCRYVIWLGRPEAQGIALEEALASDVPVLVWDVPSAGHWVRTEDEKTFISDEMQQYVGQATSAPYFDSSCGLTISGIAEVDEAVDRMERDWKKFKPREYVKKNLSLEKQAKELLEYYEKYWGLTREEGLGEKLLASGDYRSALLQKLSFSTSNIIRSNEILFKAYKTVRPLIKRSK